MFVIKIENYCFLKLISSNKNSTKESTLQLLPQFPSISSSESELETEYSSFKKRGKYHKENEVLLKKRKIKSLNSKFWWGLFFQSSLVHKTLPCNFDGDLKCYIFLKTVLCKDSIKFWSTSWVYYYGVIVYIQTNA